MQLVTTLNLHQVLPQVFIDEGDGKDLGHALEFKTEMQLILHSFR